MGAPQGWYFVSGSGDKYAKLWYTEKSSFLNALLFKKY